MGQELQIPASFQAPAKAFAALKQNSLAAGIGQSYGVLSYKGKNWSLRYRGERKTFIRPDDGTPSGYLDVIILGAADVKSKSFYAKYDPNDADGGDRPLCSSINGLEPEADVLQKQAAACALCPRNVWKTDPQTGRRGRECTDYKRLAVLVLPTQTKLILGQPLMEPVFLRVPPASLNSLAIMGEGMDARGFPFSSYVTRITFDPNKSWPEMQFKPLQALSENEAPVILEMVGNPLVKRIVEGDGTSSAPADSGVTILPPGGDVLGGVAGPLPPTATPAPDIVIPAALTAAQAVSPAPELKMTNGHNGQAVHTNGSGGSTVTGAGLPPAPPSTIAPGRPTPLNSDLAASAQRAITGIGDTPGIGTSTPSAAPPTAPYSADNSILSGGVPAAAQASSPSATQSAQPSASAPSAPADAGVAEESDADLDARIASMLTAPKA